MKNTIFKFVLAGAVAFLSVFSINAQNAAGVEPEIKQYVANKAKKAKVPAEINSFVKGDLNGDGKDDTAVQYYIQIGFPGNLTNTYLAVFLNKNGKMRLAAETDTIVVPTAIRDRLLIGDKYGNDTANKFEKIGTVSYQLRGSKLIEVKANK